MDSPLSHTRRAFLAGCGLTVLAGCTVNSASTPPEQPSKIQVNWPQFGQNPAKTNYIPEVSIPSRMTIEWSTHLDVPRTSPVVVGNTVYLGVDNQVVAVDAESGKVQWRTETTGQPTGTPAIKDEFVVYTEGKETFPFEGEISSKVGALRALAAETGKERWRVPVDGGGFAPTISGETVYIRTIRGAQAHNLRDGSTRWKIGGLPRFQTNLPPLIPDLSPATAEGRLFIPNPDSIRAVDAITGEHLWERKINQVRATPAVAHGTVYASGVRSGLQTLDAETGEVNWSWSGSGCWTSPAVAIETVYVTESADVVALDAATGSELWRYFNNGNSYSAPAVSENAVIVGSLSREAVALETHTEVQPVSKRKYWAFGESGARFSPAVTGDKVIVAGKSGQLHALTEN